MSETTELKKVIFNMLNFTNMYCLVLDGEMKVRFVNMSLALDLEYDSYEDILGQCWLNFIDENEKKIVKTVYNSVASGSENWESKYRELQSSILTKNGKIINVHWFNSHINTGINWSFSFGIKRVNEHGDDIRDFYQDIIKRDRVMINSMRDSMGLRDEIVKTCKPSLIGNI